MTYLLKISTPGKLVEVDHEGSMHSAMEKAFEIAKTMSGEFGGLLSVTILSAHYDESIKRLHKDLKELDSL